MLLVARVWLLLNRTAEEEESNATHDDPCVDPEFIIRQEDWVNHKIDEANFEIPNLLLWQNNTS